MPLIAATLGIALLAIGVADAFQTVVVARHGQKLPTVTSARAASAPEPDPASPAA